MTNLFDPEYTKVTDHYADAIERWNKNNRAKLIGDDVRGSVFDDGCSYPWIKADIDDTNPKDLLASKKPPLTLIPAPSLIYLSRVMELGAKKYGSYNWRSKKVKRTIYLEAAMRHILSDLDGEEIDPESGQPHMAHAMANMAIALDAMATGNLIDDRPVKGTAAQLINELTEK